MKSLILVFALVAVSFGQLLLPNEQNGLDLQAQVRGLQFLEGFLEGLGTHFTFEEVAACIEVDKQVYANIVDVINLLQQHTAESTSQALRELADIVDIIPKAAATCGAGLKELGAVLEIFKDIRNPVEFFYHAYQSIKINRVEISKDIDAGVAAWGNQAYRQSGQSFGNAFALVFYSSKAATSPAYAQELNSIEGKLWEATSYPQFEKLTLQEFRKTRLGTYKQRNVFLPSGDITPVNDIPSTFDSRQQWPDCIHPIRDQQRCGSCWAFGASEALSDRFCIATQGAVNVVLSPQYLVSCDRTDYGCNGGYLDHVWTFLETSGTVTDSCWSYHSGGGVAPDCRTFKACEDGQPIVNYFAKRGSSRSLTNPASIKAEILANGPIETGFRVYQDFLSYKSGIYHHTSGSLLGGHAVKILGWGKEGNANYWLVANSWNTSWGEQGYFRIQEGDCGFDSDGIAGTPDLDRH